MSLKGKKILVTGAAKRIGREIALHLAAQGAQVLIHYHRSGMEARQLKKLIRAKFGINTPLLRADLSDEIQVMRLADEAWKGHGPIDGLINNASTFFSTPLGKYKKTDFDSLFRVNAMAPLILMDRLGKKMKARGRGKIVNIGDHCFMKPPIRYVTYAASKAALASMSQGFARSLAPEVQVNLLLLGPILWPSDYPEKAKKAVLEKTLLKKIGTTGEICRMIAQLLAHGDFMTGSMIHLDGGASLA